MNMILLALLMAVFFIAFLYAKRDSLMKVRLNVFDSHVNVTTDTRTSGQTYPDYNDLSPEMKTYYDKRLITVAGPNLIHAQFGQKRPIPAHGGKEIQFRRYSKLPKAMTPLTEGVTPDGKRLDVTEVRAEVSQYGDYVILSDVLELTAIDNNIDEAIDLIGDQAGLTIDTVVRNAMQSGTNVTFCPKTVNNVLTEVTSRSNLDLTAILTTDMIVNVETKLKKMNAPKFPDGYYHCIINPAVVGNLGKQQDWKEAHKYVKDDTGYYNDLGVFSQTRFFESTEAKVYHDSTCPSDGSSGRYAVFGTLFFGANAYGDTEVEGGGLEIIVKQKGSSGTADPLNQRSSVGWKALHTAELLVPEYIVRCESCVPEYAYDDAN